MAPALILLVAAAYLAVRLPAARRHARRMAVLERMSREAGRGEAGSHCLTFQLATPPTGPITLALDCATGGFVAIGEDGASVPVEVRPR